MTVEHYGEYIGDIPYSCLSVSIGEEPVYTIAM